jgi:hypothetical protein
MARKLSGHIAVTTLVAMVLLLAATALPTWAQNATYGTISVTVLDPSGAVVSGAQLHLQDKSTNDVRNAVTQDKGNYTFVNLTLGTYQLTVTKPGFETNVIETVTVHSTETTDVAISLKVGSESQKVEVDESATPLIETSSNAIGSLVDMKQLEDLPITGRDVIPGSRIFRSPGWRHVERSAGHRPGQQRRRRYRQHQPHEVHRQHRPRGTSSLGRHSGNDHPD